MPLYNVFVKSVKDRVRFAQAIRAYQPKITLTEAIIATRAICLAKDITDADYLTNLVGESAELHIEKKMSPEEVEQDIFEKQFAEAKKWYADISDFDKLMVDTLVKASVHRA